MVTIRDARLDDAAAIAAIHNIGIAERGATFETEPRSERQVVARIEDRERYPLLVAAGESGDVLGWAGLSEYRPRACYAGIGEFSIYLSPEARGRGIGRGRFITCGRLAEIVRGAGCWRIRVRLKLHEHIDKAIHAAEQRERTLDRARQRVRDRHDHGRRPAHAPRHVARRIRRSACSAP